MNPLQRFTNFVGNEIEYRTNEFNKAAQETRTKAENGLKVRQQREASAGRALTNIKDNTVSSVQRANQQREDGFAILAAEQKGDTSKLTEEQKDLSRPIGSKSTLNGKPVKWSGQNYGWQSEASYKKLEKEGQFRGGDIGYGRIQNDMADGLLDTLGEENAVKLAETIQTVYDTYEKNAPGALKDALAKGGDLFNQVNEEISRTTNISPQITSELLIELGTVGAGKLVKQGGKAGLKAAAKTDLGSRVQELQRGLRGRSARPLNTGGSVGAAGKPGLDNSTNTIVRPGKRSGTINTNAIPRTPASQRRAQAVKDGFGRGDRNNAGVVTPEGQQLAKDSAKNNTRRFTPATRAQAAQRANARVVDDVKVVGNKPHHGTKTRTNAGLGLQTERDWRGNPSGGRGTRNELSIQDTRSDGYVQSGREDSGYKERLRTAASQDMLGRELNDLQPYDTVHGIFEPGEVGRDAGNFNTGEARARSRLIGRQWTDGVIEGQSRGGNAPVRFDSERWSDGSFRNIKGDRKELPDTGEKLRNLAEAPTQRLGRAAGGTSDQRFEFTGNKYQDIIDSNFDEQLTPDQKVQMILEDADAYSGKRLNDDAADAISQIQTNSAPANTVNRKGQTRGPAVRERAQEASRQNELNIRRQELEDQAYQRQAEINLRNQREEEIQVDGLDEFSELSREQQAQANVVRRREQQQAQGASYGRRVGNDVRRRQAQEGSNVLPMEYEYDTVANRDRLGISSGTASVQAGGTNARRQGPRTQNTLDGRRVINDSENRAMRGRVAAQQQAQIDARQEPINARNRIADNPNRQQMAIQRGQEMGDGRLAELNYNRRGDGRIATANQLSQDTYQDERDRQLFNVRRNQYIRRNVDAHDPALLGDRQQMQAPRVDNSMRQGQALQNKLGSYAKKAANNRRAKEAAAETARQQRLAASRQKRYASGRAARQSQGAADATAAFENGPQPVKGGEEGSRLFTPRNRAVAAQRSGNKLNPQHSSSSRNTSIAGGKAAYANKHKEGRDTVHDVGFRSTNLNKQYARDAERKLEGETVTPKSKTKRKQDSAVIKNNLATIFSRVKQGDVVTASPIEGINGRNGRAKLYDRMSKGALKADDMDNIESRRLTQSKWKRRDDGEVKDWNPEDLRKDLDALTQTTPEQLRGRAAGGSSKLRIKGKNIPGTKALSIDKQTRPKANTRANKKRQQQALNRISKFAEKNNMSAEEAVQYLQSNLN